MGNLLGAFIFPHPPIMINEVGGRETLKVENTIKAVNLASQRIDELKPDTIIVITPHGPSLEDVMSIAFDDKLSGDLNRFSAPSISYEFENDLELVDEIIKRSDNKMLFCAPISKDVKKTYHISSDIDHGALVPLHFIYNKYKDFKLVLIRCSMQNIEDHYRFGMAIREAIEHSNKDVVIVASGDLSHKLTKDAPFGYSPKGAEFDTLFIELLRKGDIQNLLMLDHNLIDESLECGFRSFVVLFGAFDGFNVNGQVFSYEGPFGVGYCVAEIHYKDFK